MDPCKRILDLVQRSTYALARRAQLTSDMSRLRRMLRKVDASEPGDRGCAETFAVLDRYAHEVVNGESETEISAAVKKHLQQCSDCREEYELLRNMLLAEPPPS